MRNTPIPFAEPEHLGAAPGESSVWAAFADPQMPLKRQPLSGPLQAASSGLSESPIEGSDFILVPREQRPLWIPAG